MVAENIQKALEGGNNSAAQHKLELNLPADDPKNWTNLFSGHTLAGRSMSLGFIPPAILNAEKFVALNQDEVLRKLEWKHALILYVVGDCPTIGALERFMPSQWNFIAKPKENYHNDGYFLLKFSSMEDRDSVLWSGPYTLKNNAMILKVWSPEFDFNSEILQTTPLWVRFPNLSLSC